MGEDDHRSGFGPTYIKIGTIQRRLAWPLRKDDTQNREAFHIFASAQRPFLSQNKQFCIFRLREIEFQINIEKQGHTSG